LVYSISSKASFERLEEHHQIVQRVKGKNPILILVGNKCDKTDEREVSKEEGIAAARSYGCEFIETSAKTAPNVEQLFASLIRLLRQAKGEEMGAVGQPVETTQKKKRSKCIIM
jgi:GTPase KRas